MKTRCLKPSMTTNKRGTLSRRMLCAAGLPASRRPDHRDQARRGQARQKLVDLDLATEEQRRGPELKGTQRHVRTDHLTEVLPDDRITRRLESLGPRARAVRHVPPARGRPRTARRRRRPAGANHSQIADRAVRTVKLLGQQTDRQPRLHTDAPKPATNRACAESPSVSDVMHVVHRPPGPLPLSSRSAKGLIDVWSIWMRPPPR